MEVTCLNKNYLFASKFTDKKKIIFIGGTLSLFFHGAKNTIIKEV